MEITVKFLTGKQLKFQVKKTDTVRSLKEKIQEKEGIPPDQQIIKKKDGKQLKKCEKQLSEYTVEPGSILFLVLRIDIGIFDHHPDDPFRRFLV